MSNTIKKALNSAETVMSDEPQPLIREVGSAAEFPVHALGIILGGAALAIQDITQAPLSMCSQSVLAAATLAAQGLADVQLPRGGGKGKPLSGFFVTVAATGERKSTVDALALTPIREREAALRAEYTEAIKVYNLQAEAYAHARKKAVSREKGKDARTAIEANLRALGDPPLPPLQPMLTCSDPTIEGLGKMLPNAWPSLGIFSTEGGTFVGGYGMTSENRVKTSAGLSGLWDGTPLDRVRSADGVSIMVGRRVSAHLMMQHGVAEEFLGDSRLADQGLLSRLLLVAPDSTSGTRLESGRTVKPESQLALENYHQTLSSLLRIPLPLADGARNELNPTLLTLEQDAQTAWLEFHDRIETQSGDGGRYESIRGLACKAAEHVARISGVLTLVSSPQATTIGLKDIQSACVLVEFYLSEAMRLFGKAAVNIDMLNAEKVRKWLNKSWKESHISLSDLIRFGPACTRDNKSAQKVMAILAETGHVQETLQPVVIRGQKRRHSWRIIKVGTAP